jgi:hypothetical protein
MLVSLAAAAAVFAGCGGGADPATPGAEAPATAPAAALAAAAPAITSATNSATTPDPQAADTGPIALWEMDAEAQAEAAAQAQRELQPADGSTHKSGTATGGKIDEQADKAAALADGASPADSAAQQGADDTVVASSGAAAPATGKRSGGRAVPLPATLATATDTAAGGDSGSLMEVQQAVAARAINSTDIRLQVEADRLFSSYKWAWGMECAGQKAGAVNIPEYGLLGFDLGGGLGSTRFGKVSDPENSARKVLMFRPNSGDPLLSGAPRCEMIFSPSFGGKLPVNQDVWFAFGIRLKDWVNTTDEQILMQWHWSNGSIPLEGERRLPAQSIVHHVAGALDQRHGDVQHLDLLRREGAHLAAHRPQPLPEGLARRRAGRQLRGAAGLQLPRGHAVREDRALPVGGRVQQLDQRGRDQDHPGAHAGADQRSDRAVYGT